jgi:hypothetical protein
VRRAALLLFAALLPMLTYVGHWPAFAIAIPGTAYELSLPFVAAETAAGDHHQHCHADAADCSSGPGSVALAISVLAAGLAFRIPEGPLRLIGGASSRLRVQFLPAPEPGPPRAAAATARFA